MSKIIVEDRTKPSNIDHLVDALANTVNLYSVSIGKSAGLSEKEIVAGVIQAAEEMVRFLLLMGLATETEVERIREKATKEAEKRTEQLKQIDLPNLVKKTQGESNE